MPLRVHAFPPNCCAIYVLRCPARWTGRGRARTAITFAYLISDMRLILEREVKKVELELIAALVFSPLSVAEIE